MNGNKQSEQEAKPKNKVVVDFNFSGTEKNGLLVMSLTDGVDSRLVVFDWLAYLPKVLAVHDFASKTVVSRVSFCPADDTLVCISGPQVFTLLKVTDGHFKP